MKQTLIAGALALVCSLSTPAVADPARRSRASIAQRVPVGASLMTASYYGSGEYLNALTASGERFRASGLTAAHRTLPFGTRLLVSRGGRSVVVRVNDRGPAAWTGRSLDLSRGAASRIGMLGAGVARVSVTVLH
ncbi:septal ring lytic transglycosylase RlpA family protein [Methylocystis sp. S23]